MGSDGRRDKKCPVILGDEVYIEVHVLLEIDDEGDLECEADDAQIHQPPPIIRLKGYAIFRVKGVVGSDYADDSLIADESTPTDSGKLVPLLSNSPEVRPTQDTRNTSENLCGLSHLPAKRIGRGLVG